MDDVGEGESKWLLEFIPKIIFLGISITVIVVFTSLLVINKVDTSYLEMEVLFNKLMYTSSGLAYQDSDIGRTYRGVIDLDKVDTKRLNETLQYVGRKFAAKITLSQKTAFYPSEKKYLRLMPLSALDGPGGADRLIREFDVMYYNNGFIGKGKIKIDIVRLRS